MFNTNCVAQYALEDSLVEILNDCNDVVCCSRPAEWSKDYVSNFAAQAAIYTRHTCLCDINGTEANNAPEAWAELFNRAALRAFDIINDTHVEHGVVDYTKLTITRLWRMQFATILLSAVTISKK